MAMMMMTTGQTDRQRCDSDDNRLIKQESSRRSNQSSSKMKEVQQYLTTKWHIRTFRLLVPLFRNKKTRQLWETCRQQSSHLDCIFKVNELKSAQRKTIEISLSLSVNNYKSGLAVVEKSLIEMTK